MRKLRPGAGEGCVSQRKEYQSKTEFHFCSVSVHFCSGPDISRFASRGIACKHGVKKPLKRPSGTSSHTSHIFRAFSIPPNHPS